MVNFIPEKNAFYPTDHCGVLRVKTNDISPYYVSFALFIVGDTHGFSRSYRASIDRIGEVKIPIPPIEVQKQIIEACSKTEEEFNETRMSVDEYRGRINNVFYDFGVISREPT